MTDPTEGARFRCSRVHWPVCTSLAYHSFETTNLYYLSVTSASHHCTARLRSKNERELSMRKSICESAGSIGHHFELSKWVFFRGVPPQALYHATPKTAAGVNIRPISSCLTRFISSSSSGSGVLSECDRFTTVSGCPRHRIHQQGARF